MDSFATLSPNVSCGDHFHFEERLNYSRSHQLSLDKYSSNSDYFPSSPSYSMDNTNFDSFELDEAVLRDKKYETSRFRDIRQDQHCCNTIHSKENSEIIDSYPSGRKPLIPLQFDLKSNDSEKQRIKIRTRDDEADDDLSESLSWLSRTLCVTPAETDPTCDLSSHSGDLEGCSHKVSNLFGGDLKCAESLKPGCTKLGDNLKVNVGFNEKENIVEKDVSSSSLQMIEAFLQRNALFCDTLESWYDMTDTKNELVQRSSNTFCRVAHNRSTNMTARKKKMEYLRKNMAPFDIDLIELNEGSINTEKYSPCENRNINFSFSNFRPSNPSKGAQLRTLTEEDSLKGTKCSTKCSPIITAGCGDFTHIREIPIVPSEDDLDSMASDDDMCYDSDPSDLMSSLQSPSKRKLHPVQLRKLNSIYDHNVHFDDNTCLEKICEHMNTKRLLIWHRQSTDRKTFHPIAVHTWIELGSQLDATLIQPKFCWRKSYDKEPHDRSVLNIFRFSAVDLLDISKVVAVSKCTYRWKYPYIKRSCSFVIDAFDQELIFEARDEAERNNIVEGLKLLVARLGSKIMIGDGKVLDEFFSPLGASVPGRIPAIFTSDSQEM